MNTKFTLTTRDLYRICCTALAALLIVAGLPILQSKPAYAAQFFQRSIQLSDAGFSSNSLVPVGIGSGTNVTYRVSFTAINPGASMVIDFCSNNAIVNDTCTAPAGMALTGATLNTAQITGNVYGSNGWTLTTTANQVRIANSGNAAQNIVAGAQVFELSGITNPNYAGSYYARMYSYQNNTYGAYVSPASTANSQSAATGGIVDYGGIALSTSNTITITARVQETLTFCVTKANPTSWTTTNDCSDPVVALAANYPALTLGHNAGGSVGTPVLDPTQVDTATIYSQLSTNASSGAVINMRNSNFTCGGLSADNNTTCAIPAVTDGNTGSAGYQAGPIVAGTAAFGVFVSQGVANTNGGIGTLIASPAYHDPAHTTFPTDLWYGMDSSTATGPGAIPATVAGSVRSTYGSTVASTTAPIARVQNTYIFAAAASLTTPAGIYTANLSMVATGTF